MSQPPAEQGLGDVVGRGMSWSVVGTAWVKAASFSAQIVLGYVLSDSDWGVYAIAISLAAILRTLRDGGANELLVQRGPDAYGDLRGPVFWMGCAINVLLAGSLAVGAPIAADFYGEPEVAPVLWVLSAALLLNTPALILRAKLRIDLRFVTYAKLGMVSAVIQFGGAIAFAVYGFGALSFVLPLPIISVVEIVILGLLTRDAPWRGAPMMRRWWALVREVKWLLVGTIANVIVTMGDYLVLGRLIPAEVVGVYYFAFQLTAQVSLLASTNVNTVLMPTLARLKGDVDRQRRATLRSLRALTLVSAPLSLGLAAIIAPLEMLIWGGIWEPAVVPVQILCVMMPIRLSFMITSSSLKARGAFRAWAVLTLALGLGVLATAVVVGNIRDDARSVALFLSVYFSIATPLVLWASLRDLGCTIADLVRAMVPSWLISVAVGGACLGLDTQLAGRLAAGLRLAVIFVGFSVSFGVLCRVLIPAQIRDTLSVLPRPLAVFGRRLLWMRE